MSSNSALRPALLAVLLTFVVFIPALFNDFTIIWDDGGYIHNLNSVQQFNLKDIFSDYVHGNYHPFLLLGFAIEYSMVGLKPMLFHLNNILIHLLNVYLVFLLIKKLSKSDTVAFITALFFGIHPMHVESIAWIAERKDVMYTAFFLISSLFYLEYIKQSKLKYILLSLLFFVFSIMSKSAAVCLPVLLFVFDWWEKRKFNVKLFTEKIPFLLVAILFGVIAVKAQAEAGAIQNLTPLFSPFERIFISSWATILYFFKLILPINLSAMYPYPVRVGGLLPFYYYAAPLVILIAAFLLYRFRKQTRPYLFGLFFFAVTIGLVIQLIPVGAAILAERYSYVPYIGLFFIVAMIVRPYVEKKKNAVHPKRTLVIIILAAFGLFWSVLTEMRIPVWKDDISLFKDMTAKCPNQAFAFNNLGYAYQNQKQDFPNALIWYDQALLIDSSFYMTYSNRAIIYFNQNRYPEAIRDFGKCLKLKPDYPDALLGRANTLSRVDKYADAIPDYDNYIKIRPADTNAYLWRGIARAKTFKYPEALQDFDVVIKMNPGSAQAHYWKGLSNLQLKNYEAALTGLNTAIGLNANNAEYYSWRGIVFYNLKRIPESIADYTKAIELSPADYASRINRAVSYRDSGNFAAALEDLTVAGKAGFPIDQQFFLQVQKMAGGK
ncbi:MAG: tetratricopeptide repeat protein [Bacteroidota bacterium]